LLIKLIVCNASFRRAIRSKRSLVDNDTEKSVFVRETTIYPLTLRYFDIIVVVQGNQNGIFSVSKRALWFPGFLMEYDPAAAAAAVYVLESMTHEINNN